jgi:CubicO group peptidase (beta-lactamase class C family)
MTDPDSRWTRRDLFQFGVGVAVAGGAALWPRRAAWADASGFKLSEKGFEAAAEYSEATGGWTMLVFHDGEIVFERYARGAGQDTAIMMASATKSFWGVAAAAMVEDGLLEFDERAADTLTEWDGDPNRGRITVRHLLDLSSGLAEDVPAIQGAYPKPTWVKNKYTHAVGLPGPIPPGQRFRYGPSHFYAFGELIRRKLHPRNQSPLDYLKARILDPIACTFEKWVHDGAGNVHIPNGCYMTAREWLKFGRLVLDGGRWQGAQIVAAEPLAECFHPSAPNPGYGLTWWLNYPGGQGASPRQQAPEGLAGGFIYHDGLHDIAGALGAGRNGLYVVPSLELVVVRQISSEDTPDEDRQRFGRGFSDHEFLARLFGTA